LPTVDDANWIRALAAERDVCWGIGPDQFFYTRIKQLAALTLNHAVPAISQNRPFAATGGLMSYGGNETEYYRLVGVYAGKVLNGEKPADLPVQQTTKVELIINLKTAKALGLTVPLPLLGRADDGEMNGVELAREARRLRPNVPVVLTTGYSSSADAALREGFFVLRKPYDLDGLRKMLSAAFGSQEAAATAH
jgi:CheY-like chemotaxis protein